MSNLATGQSSTIRRTPQTYANIPSSSSPSSPSSAFTSDTGLGENTSFGLAAMDTDSSITSLSATTSRSSKRKLSDASHTRDESLGSKVKKTKLTPPNASSTGKRKGSGSASTKAKAKPATVLKSDEFPNGYFYCHQCNKKRDLTDGVQCTMKDASSNVQNTRCKAKYCGPCLKNRYGESLADIKAQSLSILPRKEREQHVTNEEYYFKCPRCRGICNCRGCRKAQGLEPTGNLSLLARREGKESAAQILNSDPKATGILPGKGKQTLPVEKEAKSKIRKAKAPEAGTSANGNAAQTKTKPVKKAPVAKAKPTPKPKPLPKPVWTRIPTSLTQSAAEVRIHIREFALRFGSIMDIAKSSLDELEELETDRSSTGSLSEDQTEELVGWVSEQCVKGLVMGLLGLLADSHNAGETGKAIKEALRELRTSGANLNKIWGALSSLRDVLEGGDNAFTFPDPLPPPSTVTFRSTRSALGGELIVHVATTAQLVPVIAGLLDAATVTHAVREEIERGAAREKELTKDVREAIAQENAKWKETRASVDENKAKGKGKGQDVAKTGRGQHKQMLLDLEFAHRVVQFECIPRFSELGRDHQGRVYFALTPGPMERDAAEQLLSGGDGRVKFTKRRPPVLPEDRKKMLRWSWFVGVWGRRPEGAIVAKAEESEDGDLSDDEEEETDEWWGFWDPQEIKKMAEWLAVKNNLSDSQGEDSAEIADAVAVNGVVSKKSAAHSALEDANDLMLLSSGLDDSRPPSPMSDISSDVASDEEEQEEIQMRVDSEGRPLPCRQQLRELVKGLNEYAELLEWRIQRMQGEDTVEKTDKDARVSAKSFYGI